MKPEALHLIQKILDSSVGWLFRASPVVHAKVFLRLVCHGVRRWPFVALSLLWSLGQSGVQGFFLDTPSWFFLWTQYLSVGACGDFKPPIGRFKLKCSGARCVCLFVLQNCRVPPNFQMSSFCSSIIVFQNFREPLNFRMSSFFQISWFSRISGYPRILKCRVFSFQRSCYMITNVKLIWLRMWAEIPNAGPNFSNVDFGGTSWFSSEGVVISNSQLSISRFFRGGREKARI